MILGLRLDKAVLATKVALGKEPCPRLRSGLPRIHGSADTREVGARDEKGKIYAETKVSAT